MRALLIATGVLLLAAGLLWPWLGRLGLGHLPGDISIRGQRVSFYFPLTTGIVISVVVSLVLWLISR